MCFSHLADLTYPFLTFFSFSPENNTRYWFNMASKTHSFFPRILYFPVILSMRAKSILNCSVIDSNCWNRICGSHHSIPRYLLSCDCDQWQLLSLVTSHYRTFAPPLSFLPPPPSSTFAHLEIGFVFIFLMNRKIRLRLKRHGLAWFLAPIPNTAGSARGGGGSLRPLSFFLLDP